MASKYDPCIKQLTKLAGEAFGKDEAEKLFQTLQDKANTLESASSDKKLQALREAAGEFAERSTMQAKVRKMRLAQDNIVLYGIKKHMALYPDNPSEGYRTFLTGAENVRFGAHASVDAYVKAAKMHVIKGFLGEVEGIKTVDGTNSAHDLAQSGALDRRLAWKLSSLTDDTVKVPSVDPHTDAIADAVAAVSKNHQNATLNRLNLNGCNIVDMKGRITTQAHPPENLVKLGKDKWKEIAKENFDPSSYQGKEPDVFLDSMYSSTTSGVRLSKEGKPENAFRKFAGDMAENLSRPRLIKFKDPDAALAYRKALGVPGNLFTDITKEIENGARNSAIMERMGSDPYGMHERIVNETEVAYRDNLPVLERFKGRVPSLEKRLKNITGFTSVNLDPSVSNIYDSFRVFVSTTSQWLSVLNSAPDIAVGVNQMSLWGRATHSTLSDFAKEWSQRFGSKGGDAWESSNHQSLYLAEEYMLGLNSDWRESNDMGALGRKIVSTMYRWNQQTKWDEVMRSAVAKSVSRIMGQHADSALADIASKDVGRELFKYGIDSDSWDVMRQSVYKADNSGLRNYITGDTVQGLPDEAFNKLLTNQGKTITKYATERARNQLATKVTLILNDTGDHVITLAGANEKAIMNQGEQRGTHYRGLLDLVSHLRGYALASAYRTYASQIYGRGSDSLLQALSNKNGELLHISRNIALGMLCWYIGDSAKSAIMGQKPRTVDTQDPFSRANVQNLASALAGSGGVGPYADLLTHDFGGGGSQLAAAVLGPDAGKIAQTLGLAYTNTGALVKDKLQGDQFDFDKKLGEVGAKDVDFASKNIPGINIPPLRTTLNYLILFQLENWLNPDYNKRKEERIQKDTGQEYFFPPSQQ